MYALIPVKGAGCAKVSIEDVDKLSQYIWGLGGAGYPMTYLKGRRFCMHSLVIRGMPDHIDRDKLNNQRSNLRPSTKSLNAVNTIKRSKCSSKYKGVHWCKRDGKWEAGITLNYKRTRIGQYDNEIIAALAYDKKAKELFGEFAVLNYTIT